MVKFWFDGDGKVIVDDAGKPIDCEDCACDGGVGDDCTHCDPAGSTPAEISITISGVAGCNGLCANRNLTVVLTQASTCTWNAFAFAPLSAEMCGEDYGEFVQTSIELIITGTGTFQVTVFDEIFGASETTSSAIFTGTFSGPCNELSATASLDSSTTGFIPSYLCNPPDTGCEDWCDWSGASISVNAL